VYRREDGGRLAGKRSIQFFKALGRGEEGRGGKPSKMDERVVLEPKASRIVEELFHLQKRREGTIQLRGAFFAQKEGLAGTRKNERRKAR